MTDKPALIEIFRSGTHTATNGVAVTMGTADLDQIARSYSPATHEAPLVVGHPKTDDPAMGWVNRVVRQGQSLFAVPDQVNPAFAEAVKAGSYKKVSASFYPPDHPGNPTPGHWYLRHVGFLGAMPPAVKGMRPVSFAEDTKIVEFADWERDDQASILGLFRGLRDFIIAKFGLDAADAALPGWTLDNLQDQTAAPDPLPAPSPDPLPDPTHTGDTMTAFAEQQAALESHRKQLADDRAALEREKAAAIAAAEAARRAACTDFADGLVRDAKLPGAEKGNLVALMMAIKPEPVDFSEGAATVKMAPDQWLKNLLSKAAVRVPQGEAPKGQSLDFSESVESITAASIKYRTEQKAAGREISASQAISELKKSGVI